MNLNSSITVGGTTKRTSSILSFTSSIASTTDSTEAAKSMRTFVSTATSMARLSRSAIDHGQTLFQKLLALRLGELVHLWPVFLNNPSSNRFLGRLSIGA